MVDNFNYKKIFNNTAFALTATHVLALAILLLM